MAFEKLKFGIRGKNQSIGLSLEEIRNLAIYYAGQTVIALKYHNDIEIQ